MVNGGAWNAFSVPVRRCTTASRDSPVWREIGRGPRSASASLMLWGAPTCANAFKECRSRVTTTGFTTLHVYLHGMVIRVMRKAGGETSEHEAGFEVEVRRERSFMRGPIKFGRSGRKQEKRNGRLEVGVSTEKASTEEGNEHTLRNPSAQFPPERRERPAWRRAKI